MSLAWNEIKDRALRFSHYKESEEAVNIEAAERMGQLHDKLKAIGYEGHELEVYLVRLLFCLFADNTSIFERWQFKELIQQRTTEDGSDLARLLDDLYQVLNKPQDKRLKNLDEQLAAFPYVNGQLFEQRLSTASFDAEMRRTLLNCCELDWGRISPAIFGSLFQSVMDLQKRRKLGAHYTSEKNIFKLIKPLFLDDLRAEFEAIKKQRRRLQELHKKIAELKFLDPACGCGNFLVVAYRELRELELDILLELNQDNSTLSIDITLNILCNVDQFYGIEIEEFPAQIAQTALWLTDHQMNLKVSEKFGQYYVRLPLKKSATIVQTDALEKDWSEIINPNELNYILGNPPFSGAKYMTDEQRNQITSIFSDVKSSGLLDYVTGWYRKAADYMILNPNIKTAFVSTNSISQGEQVGILWTDLLSSGVKINFAHRTFEWSSEARGKATVHCVIIGFALSDLNVKRLFDYENVKSEPSESKAKNINPYLVDALNLVVLRRSNPLCNVPDIGIGNKPIDGGHYLFTTEEKDKFLIIEPSAAPYFLRWLGSDEFINGYERWCLWLGNCSPHILKKMPEAMKRVEAVRSFRLDSKSIPTQKLADTPTRFHVENMPSSDFLVIPKVSSQRRPYIPIGFLSSDTLCSDLVFIAPNTTLYHFGVLTSAMHMTWVKQVCGRLGSGYRYSKDIVYNNYPWPESPRDNQKKTIEKLAQIVLDTRQKYPNSSLADLYDPLTMPWDLVKAHQKLDTAVDKLYRPTPFTNDRDRIEHLFELYQKLTTLSPK